VKRIQLDHYVLDTLMPDLVGHDRHASAFVVYLFLWRHSKPRAATPLSLRTIADGTGLSKRAVQTAVRRLRKRRLVTVGRKHITATPTYSVQRPWRKKAGRIVDRKVRSGSA